VVPPHRADGGPDNSAPKIVRPSPSPGPSRKGRGEESDCLDIGLQPEK